MPIAEKNSTGGWTDYIFANGQRIARVDPTTNLVPYSQQFGNSSWNGYCGPTSNMTSNTAAVTAPDGTNTATQFVVPTTIACDGSQPGWGVLTTIPSGLQVGQTYTVSVWMRGANGGESVGFGMNDCSFGGVTLTSSWQRYTATFTNIPSSIANCSDGSRGFQVAAGSSPGATYYIWGAQVEQATSAGPYVATGSSTETLHYYTSDHLGTTTLITDGAGALQNDSDFYPFGAENIIAAADPNHYKFTGKERDTESGNDYFGARYYSSAMGRFMSPDWSAKAEPVPYAKLDDPQTLNLYSYVGNNPLSRADADGHESDKDKEKKLPAPDAQHDHTITVRQVSGQGVNVAGHATVQIDGGKEVGYGPKQDMSAKQVAENKSVPGQVELRAAGAKTEDQVTVHVTGDQAKAAQGTIDAVAKSGELPTRR